MDNLNATAINEALLTTARQMILAAITAPKGRGMDNIRTFLVPHDKMEQITKKMTEIASRSGQDFFVRDAQNLMNAPYVLFIGSIINPLGLSNCGLCGFKNCDEKKNHSDVPCTFNTTDLGIAIGSAVSIAAIHHVDNRVMFSAGIAVKELGLMGADVKTIFGIPLSASAKNPFFDRK